MRFLRIALAAAVATVATVASVAAQIAAPVVTADATSVLLFAGTYTRDEGWVNGTGKGIHVFQFNTGTGALTAVGAQVVGINPTYVAGTRGATRRILYAVNEDTEVRPGVKTGWVYALRYDAAGTMTELNRVESGGSGAAHVSLSPDEKFVAVANYNGGSVSLFPVKPDGSLQPASDTRAYPRGSRDVSHMHSMTWVGGKAAYAVLAADLGNDRVAQFTVNAQTTKLVSNAQHEFIVRPVGAGPRHMAIHPTKKFAYVVDELSNTIGVYMLDASVGTLSPTATQRISTLPAGFTDRSSSADIHTSEDGAFLYSSNRGHDSIAVFKIDTTTGQLTALGHEPTRGKVPRAFLIYKQWMLVANQDSHTIQVFRMDANTGRLTYANQSVACGTPVGLFIPRSD